MDNENQQAPPFENQPPVKTANNLTFLKALSYGFVIVSVGIIIAVGGYLLGTNKSKPPTRKASNVSTVSWKTLNNNLGFSIKYPNEWQINDGCSSITGGRGHKTSQFLCTVNIQSYPYKLSGGDIIINANTGAPNGVAINVNVFSNPKSLSAEEFVVSKDGLNHENLGKISKEKIGNNEFVKESVGDEDVSQLGIFYVKNNNDKVFAIDGTIFAKDGAYKKLLSSEINRYKDIYNQILSTFRFTE